MIDKSTVYLATDQPTACPKCGVRTEIILDLNSTNNQTQVHKCLGRECGYEFFLEFDDDFENLGLK